MSNTRRARTPQGDGETATRALFRAGARPPLAAAAIALLLIGGVAVVLVRSQAKAASSLEDEFARRAVLAANLTTAALSSNAEQYPEIFTGSADKAPAQLRAFESVQPDHLSALLDAQGEVLAAWPPDNRTLAARLAATAPARLTLGGAKSALGNLGFIGPKRAPVVTMASGFAGAEGRRTFVATLDAGVIATFASAYLASAPGVRGASAYLVDSNDRVLASSKGLAQGVLLPHEGLATALRSRSSGNLGDAYYVSAPLKNTSWKVTFLAPRSALLAPVQGATRRASWALFAAFTLALMALLRVGVAAMRRSSELVETRERERAAQELAHERLHDALTGLPNRALFLDRTDRALAIATTAGRPVAVLCIGLDRFTRINDSLGHATGDQLLVLVAERLREALRPELTLSRFGGDGFLVLCEDAETTIDIMAVATLVQAEIAAPFTLDDRVVHLTCGIGIAMHVPGTPPVTADTLVRDADAGLHQAKAVGQGQIHVRDAELQARALEQLDTEAALRTAIDTGELTVHYQPIVTLADGRLHGVEALVRWERPLVGLVPPLQFIGVAEESGLICDLGEIVLRTATEQVARWASADLLAPDFTLSVNVSAHQLDDGRLVNLVAEVLASWPLPASSLCLEITESAVARDPAAAHRTLTALQTLGVHIALDDFGTGQTSLEQLVRTLPVDIIKLDRSFVSHMDDPRDRAVVAAVPRMANGLGMRLIAEGAETAAQVATLTELGYSLVQGYHFGRPMDAASLAERLTASKAANLTA